MSAPQITTSMLLTPPGAGAIAVIRINGPDAERHADSMFRSKSGAPLLESPIGQLRYGVVADRDEVLDDIVACVVSRDECCVVDLCTHGGVRVVERVLSVLERAGAAVDESATGSSLSPTVVVPTKSDTPAPWPTTNAIERDVDEALRRAMTSRCVRFLAAQRNLLPGRVIDLADRARLEPAAVQIDLRALQANYEAARRLIDGATVSLMGPPNAGKSAVFNRLIGRDGAVVSARAGTTRDWVTGTLELDGVPLTLQDNAGEHATPDALEEAAIRAGRSVRLTADLVLLVADVSRWVDPNYAESVGQMVKNGNPGSPRHRSPPVLLVLNKNDLVDTSDTAADCAEIAGYGVPTIFVSARTGSGLAGLKSLMGRLLGVDRPVVDRPCLFATRQWDFASEALSLPITEGDGLRWTLEQLLTGSRGNG